MENYLLSLNRLRSHFFWLSAAVISLRSLLLVFTLMLICGLLQPGTSFHWFTLITLFLLVAVSLPRRGWQKVRLLDLTKALEIQYPQVPVSAFQLQRHGEGAFHAWQPVLTLEYAKMKALEKQNLAKLTSSLALPTFLFALFTMISPVSLSSELGKGLSEIVGVFQQGATLEIVQGKMEEKTPNLIRLSVFSKPTLNLMAENLVTVNLIAGADDISPIIELKRIKPKAKQDDLLQRFQFQPLDNFSETQSGNSRKYTLTFAIAESADLYLPSVASSKPLVTIHVKQQPVPQVELENLSNASDSWPDDQPLNLRINAKAENALKLIKLVVTSGKRQSEELVNNMLTSDLKEWSTFYNLVLEPYVESDIADVEIVAVAIDNSLPQPLMGKSKPLLIKTTSAYGRYQETLGSLKEIKSLLDEVNINETKELPSDVHKLMNKALSQSFNSPFFDGLDRVQINTFSESIEELTRVPSTAQLLNLSEQLNEFLFEHELLDDRERDRDFFVAIRGLSRILEQERSTRSVTIPVLTDRIKRFLDTRHGRWRLRVERLPRNLEPKSYAHIQSERPFHQTQVDIENLDKANNKNSDAQALIKLSKTAADYRTWIEELEAAEDKARETLEAKRQEALTSARSELIELQKRQAKISEHLDRAQEKEAKQLGEQWPATRADQNANINGTRRVEGQLRSLAPSASERIRAALQSMQNTLSEGNKSNFPQAETASDLSGRLLRQAESETQRAQKQKGGRGSRRRISGDRYYGQSIVGGDVEIKRDYEVDKRYREEILDEVRGTLSGSQAEPTAEQKKLLENYLRQVIR